MKIPEAQTPLLPARGLREWRLPNGALPLGERTLVMGVLNVTPDSFSDGGQFLEPAPAAEHAWQLAEEGADLLDIGGMSSRPGSEEIPPQEELERVASVLERLGSEYPIPISVDTYRSSVAREAIHLGAGAVNDITALRSDEAMGALVAETGAGLILMHMRGTPRTMQQHTEYDDLTGELLRFFCERLEAAGAAGIAPDRVVNDPGIGFGKSVEGNLELLRGCGELRCGAAGVLMGTSRKSFIGKLLEGQGTPEQVTKAFPPSERLWGTAASVALAISNGADIVRVHDVAPMLQVCRVTDAVVRGH